VDVCVRVCTCELVSQSGCKANPYNAKGVKEAGRFRNYDQSFPVLLLVLPNRVLGLEFWVFYSASQLGILHGLYPRCQVIPAVA
jgi:hypothetical protein